MNKFQAWIGAKGVGSILILALLLLVVFPLVFDIFRLNLVGKYLTYGFVAIGLVMLWGYGGVLSLGQGVFFGLGGYAMAMFLKLEASDPESTKIQSTPAFPTSWTGISSPRCRCGGSRSSICPLPCLPVVAVPTLLAFLIGYAMFKRRVGGVYFAIITQAVALILTVLIIGQQGYTGGVNGMTDLKTLLGWDIRTDGAKYILYYVCALMLLGTIALCAWIQRSKLGTLLLAMRDKEDRVRFSGYDVAMFKVFVFCLAAALSRHWRRAVHAAGGLHVALVRGHRAIHRDGDLAAVGGRMSLVGAVYGALLVNFGKTYFSESFPDLWLFLMAALFIGVTMAFPEGLAGVWTQKVMPWWRRNQAQRRAVREALARDAATPADTLPPRAAAKSAPPALSGQSA
jgi:urea transport system permease protein